MKTFRNIKELINTLKREEKLISEMFANRKNFNFKYNFALELVDEDESKIQSLIDYQVIRKNNDFLELDDVYLDFFERILDINEEINIAYINENIKNIKENIQYYFNENNEKRKYSYLKQIKNILRKIGFITLKSVIDLRRNVENTFKNEPNYKNKQLKLENLDKKRNNINNLIEQTHNLIKTDEITFFKIATDEELNTIIIDLKTYLSESSHNLIEIEKQIIDFLNQIKQQEKFIEKLRKLKYLKDQFLIQADTNIKQVLAHKNALIFETRTAEPLKLSVDFLNVDEKAFEIINKVAQKYQNRKQFKTEIAENISDEFLNNTVEEERIINLENLKNMFLATGQNLWEFILNYEFEDNLSFEEKVTIFCQIASQFEDELEVKEDFQQTNNIELATIYPK